MGLGDTAATNDTTALTGFDNVTINFDGRNLQIFEKTEQFISVLVSCW